MAKPTNIRCYDYVNHPYPDVCQAVSNHANKIFHDATKSAETRAEDVAAGLHVKIAGIEFGKDILINIRNLEDIQSNHRQQTTIGLEWTAAETARLFPVMTARLHMYPISGKETQLDFQGEYQPPLGVVGKAIDAVVGQRIAEASVHHFVAEVAQYLRENMN